MGDYDLGINLDEYSDSQSISLDEARALIRGRKGRAALEVVRRWANPRHGCRPAGATGPRLVLPTVRLNGALRTMRVWVEAFEKARVRLGQRKSAPLNHRTAGQAEAAFRRAEARLDEAGVK